jgi:hypothetical protein
MSRLLLLLGARSSRIRGFWRSAQAEQTSSVVLRNDMNKWSFNDAITDSSMWRQVAREQGEQSIMTYYEHVELKSSIKVF